MGQLEKTLLINAPLEKVWGIWIDVAKTPEWVDGVGESHITSVAKSGPGLTWEEHCMIDGKSIPMCHKMVVWEEKKKTVIKTGLPMGGSMERIAEFSVQGDQTQVRLQMEWDLGIAAMFIGEEKLQDILEKNCETTATNWKKRAEFF